MCVMCVFFFLSMVKRMIITRVIPRRQMEIVSEYDFDRVDLLWVCCFVRGTINCEC